MTAKWGICAILALCLALVVGCRAPQPIVKAPPTQERLVAPPMDPRYDVPSYPKAAFDDPLDPAKRNNMMMPAAGGRMGSPGGMGGMGR